MESYVRYPKLTDVGGSLLNEFYLIIEAPNVFKVCFNLSFFLVIPLYKLYSSTGPFLCAIFV